MNTLITLLAAIPLVWTVETSRIQPAMFEAYHGEELQLAADFKSYGKDLAIEGMAALYFQTNGMGTAYWSAPATVSSNRITAVFAPEMDPGASAVNGFLGVAGQNYRAAFKLRFLPSPGAVPGEIPLPAKKIDFAVVEVLNAPYYTKDETDERIVELAPTPGDYETVSNRAMTALQTNGGTMTGPLELAYNNRQVKIDNDSISLGGVGSQNSVYLDSNGDIYRRAGGIYYQNYWPLKSGTFATTDDIPNVPAWAQQPAKPAYTAAEVGAAPASVADTVNTWVTYWDGDEVRVTITNYYGSVDLPSLYIEQKIEDNGTNYYKTIWTEKARLGVLLDRIQALEQDLATKADRAWGFYDSHTGSFAPDGYTSISSGAILISKDMSYQKTVTAGGDVWVLTANDPTVVTGVESNGFFRITDGDGNSVIEVVKGDKRTVPAIASAVNSGNNSLTIAYNVVASGHPILEICSDLEEAAWIAEGESACPATAVWSGQSGAYSVTLTGKAPMDKMFVRGTYEIGGETYVKHDVAVGFDKVVIGGVYYRIAVETVNGKKLMVLTNY